MYGKHFSSMYEGSMVGSGAIVFAVMGYVIANYRLDAKVGAQVRLNPTLLATILGEKKADIERAIIFLCKPDGNSTTKVEQGRRLIQIGEFDYRVVNGAKYTAIKNEESRREQNRDAKRRSREKNRPLRSSSRPLMPGEGLAEHAANNGATQEDLDEIQENAEVEHARNKKELSKKSLPELSDTLTGGDNMLPKLD